MQGTANIIVLSGLLIGLVYGAVGLLSGFCMLTSLRGWWAEGDGRLVRTYALAIGVAVASTQLLAAAGLVDLGKSIYLQPSFSAPLMFCRRAVVRLRHGAVERLRLARAGAARARQSALLRGGDRARHFRDDDAEGPDRAGAHRDGAGLADHDDGRIRCRRCCRRSASAKSRRACWRRPPSARR